MAIRDRVTVRTRDGSVVGNIVEKQGGTLAISWPTKANPWLDIIELNKNGMPADNQIGTVRVPADQIVYVTITNEPRPRAVVAKSKK